MSFKTQQIKNNINDNDHDVNVVQKQCLQVN